MAKLPTSKSTIQGIGKPASIGNYTSPVPVPGCTDPAFTEYNALATVDDGSCEVPFIYGCMSDTSFNFITPVGDPLIDVNTDDGSCIPVVLGCLDPTANNYIQPTIPPNFQTQVNTDDGTCTYNVYGCTDNDPATNGGVATNYDALATIDDGSCNYDVPGCMDDGTLTLANDGVDSEYPGFQALNYDPLATVDNGSCTWSGCTDPLALDYDGPNAQVDDGSCTYIPVYGCMDVYYQEYDPLATINQVSDIDFSNPCINPHIYGCMDDTAFNYNSLATINETSLYNSSDPCILTLPLGNIPACIFVENFDDTTPTLDPNGNFSNLYLSISSVSGNYPPNQWRLNFAGQIGGFQDGSNVTSDLTMNIYNPVGGGQILNTLSIINGDVAGEVVFEWLDTAGAVFHTELVTITPFTIILGCLDSQDGGANDLPDINGNGVDGNTWVLGAGNGYENYNYNPLANYDNGDCAGIYGCTDNDPATNGGAAINYNPLANFDDGSCIYTNGGCTDPNANNYDASINIDDGSCTYDPYDWGNATMKWEVGTNFWGFGTWNVNVLINPKLSKSAYNIAGQLGEPYTVTLEVAKQSLGTVEMMSGGANWAGDGIVQSFVDWTSDLSQTNSYQFPGATVDGTSWLSIGPVTLDYFEQTNPYNIHPYLDATGQYANIHYPTPSTQTVYSNPTGTAPEYLYDFYGSSGPNVIYLSHELPAQMTDEVYVMYRFKSEDAFGNVKYTQAVQVKIGNNSPTPIVSTGPTS